MSEKQYIDGDLAKQPKGTVVLGRAGVGGQYALYALPLSDDGGAVIISGTIVVSPGVITSATPNGPVQAALTNVAAQALPANSARLWVTIQNFGSEPLYYLFGSVAQVGAASPTNCSGYLMAGEKAFFLCGAQIITSVIQWISTATGTTGNIQDGDA